MRSSRTPLGLAALATLPFVVVVALVAARRIGFPYDVEWMEGGMLTHADRIARGESVYPAPSATFVPYLYPPLYPSLLAGLGKLVGGVTYALGRSVSALATASTMGLGAYATFRATRRPELAVLTVGLMAALYSTAGSFHDLVRPDALAMALVMGAAVLAERGARGSLVASGLLLAAACFAKQTSIVMGAGVLVALHTVHGRRAALTTTLVALVCGAVAFLAWHVGTEGRFTFYVARAHQAHAFYRDNFGFYFYRDAFHLAPLLLAAPLVWLGRTMHSATLPLLLGTHLAITVTQRFVMTRDLPHMYFRDLWLPHRAWWLPPVVVSALLIAAARPPRGRSAPTAQEAGGDESAPARPLRYWGIVFVGALLAAATGHATQWAYKNSLLPLATVGVPFTVLALVELAEPDPAESGHRRAPWLVAAALLLQLVALVEAPFRLAPSDDDRRVWLAMEARLRGVGGPVMVLGHPRLSAALGSPPHLHGMGIADMAAAGGIPDLEARLARHEWRAIVVDVDDGMSVPPIVERYYWRKAQIEAPAMKTGTLSRPAELWVPR